MPFTLSAASVDTYTRALKALSHQLDKAIAHSEAKKFDPSTYMTLRLRPDMFAFARQVQVTCDHAVRGSSRLAGVEPAKFEDNETSLPELKDRIRRVVDLIGKLDRKAIDAAADRDIVFPRGQEKARMSGSDYLMQFSLPNFYFHYMAAYALLRYAGVDVGKNDFLGDVTMAKA
jgi:uncharacterized protein